MTSRSKLKPEVEFQYGGRLILETGSSNISALDSAISSKFGVQIDFDLLGRLLSLNQKPEVDIRFYGRPLENSIRRHNYAVDGSVWMKADAEWHADNEKLVKMETGSGIPTNLI